MNKRVPLGRVSLAAFLVLAGLLALSLAPQLTFSLGLLLSAPLVVFELNGQRKIAIALAVVATVCVALQGYGLAALVFGIGIYLSAFAMAESAKSRTSPYEPLVTGTLLILLVELVWIAFLKYHGVNLVQVLSDSVPSSIQLDEKVLGMQATGNSAQLVEDYVSVIQTMFPAFLVLGSFVAAVLNIVVGRWLVGGKETLRPLLFAWKLPRSAIFVFLLSVGCVFFGLFSGNAILWQTVQCLAFLMVMFFSIQGIAMIWRMIYRVKGRYVLLVLLILGTMLPFVGLIYLMLGISDAVRQHRRRSE